MWLLGASDYLINLDNVLTIELIKLSGEWCLEFSRTGSGENTEVIPLKDKTEEEAKAVFHSIVYQLNTTTAKVIKF